MLLKALAQAYGTKRKFAYQNSFRFKNFRCRLKHANQASNTALLECH